MNPLTSVIMPTHNRPHLLGRAIDSMPGDLGTCARRLRPSTQPSEYGGLLVRDLSIAISRPDDRESGPALRPMSVKSEGAIVG